MAYNADEQVNRMEAGQRICKCCPEVGKASGELVDQLSSGSKSEHRSNFVHEIEREHIREVEKNEAFGVELLFHSSTPRSLVLTLTFSLCLALDCSCSWESLRRREGLSFCLTVLAENSLKACVITSTSRPLKNTM